MKYRYRIIIALLVFIVTSFFCVFLTTTIHISLSTRAPTPVTDFEQCVESIKTNVAHREMYLLSVAVCALLSISVITLFQKTYQSKTIKITDNIQIPVPAGQGQFGTARFMDESEKKKCFKSFTIPNNLYKSLLDNGKKYYSSIYSGELAVTKHCNAEIRNGGIPINYDKGRVSTICEDVHSLVIGATRCGKTRCLVIPEICSLALAGENIIANDPKGELYLYTRSFLEDLGYKVYALDFQSPHKSDCYNPLQPIIEAAAVGDTDLAQSLTWDLVNLMVEKGDHSEPIWHNGEMSVIAAAILCVVFDNIKEPQYQNLTNVYWFISEMCRPPSNPKASAKIIEYVKWLPDTHPAKPLLGISQIAPRETSGSFYTSALTTLRLFVTKDIYAMTASSDIDTEKMAHEKTAIFFILPDQKTTFYPIVTLVMSQFYERLVECAKRCGNRLPIRTNFVLDEFGNFTKIADFEAKLTVGGGYGLRFTLILQSFDQLKSKYGDEVSSIIKGNCHYWIYLASNDNDTLKELEARLGQYTTTTYSLGTGEQKYSAPSRNQNVSLHGRNLLTNEEISRIKRPYLLIIGENRPAIMKCPDLSQWHFNDMLGLGDIEHNRKLIQQQNEMREERLKDVELKLWGIWDSYLFGERLPIGEY